MALSNVLGLQTPIYFALCNQKHIREPNSPNSWLLPFYNYPQSRGFTTVGSQRPREIFNLLQWALNDPVKSSFQRKEQKKVPWAVEYLNPGLSWIYQVYLKEGTYHTRLFRGPSTNGMKKWDGPSCSWPTPHTTPLFLPPEDPSQVLLRPNSIPG